jgi:hypothetical protein
MADTPAVSASTPKAPTPAPAPAAHAPAPHAPAAKASAAPTDNAPEDLAVKAKRLLDGNPHEFEVALMNATPTERAAFLKAHDERSKHLVKIGGVALKSAKITS